MISSEKQEAAIRSCAKSFTECMAYAAARMRETTDNDADPKKGASYPGPRVGLPGMREAVANYTTWSKGLLMLKHELPLLKLAHPHDILPPEYHGFDQTQAWMEGWWFYYGAEQECCQVGRIDFPSKQFPAAPDDAQFEYDDNALKFVRQMATENPGGYHDQALGYMHSIEGTKLPLEEIEERENT